MKTYRNLQELTGYESGAVFFPNGSGGGELFICNWTNISGIPRIFAGSYIGLGEEICAERIKTPEVVKEAMMSYSEANGEEPVTKGYKSWSINHGAAIVTINEYWI